MAPLDINLANREWLLEQLRNEIVGPDPAGNPIELIKDGTRSFSWEEFRKPKRQTNGEEILWQDPPTRRYGAGILYPVGVSEQAELEAESGDQSGISKEDIVPDVEIDEEADFRKNENKQKARIGADDSEDYDVSLANSFKPSALGISFLADFSAETKGISVELVQIRRISSEIVREQSVGIYKRVVVHIGEVKDGSQPIERPVWCRVPLRGDDGRIPSLEFSYDELVSTDKPLRRTFPGIDPDFEIVLVARRWPAAGGEFRRLVTLSLINRKEWTGRGIDDKCLYQSGFRVKGKSGIPWIHGYPEISTSSSADSSPLDEEKINQLIYRQQRTFAIGHGCSADWSGTAPDMIGEAWSDVMPVFETPSTSADLYVKAPDGSSKPLRVSMRKLAGLDPSDDGKCELDDLVEAYQSWIRSLRSDRPGVFPVPAGLEKTSEALIARCEQCLDRIRDGIRFLKEDTEDGKYAREAFRFANHSMLIAQLRATREVRNPKTTAGGLTWEPPLSNPDPSTPDPARGYWRAFQIAFLLMSLRGICTPDDPSRETVDLIWFPTGGGKTEAYLGLTAFTIFFNSLSGRKTAGVDVLMRYTLRLLTAQQFQRAALLFCAMEHLRKKNPAVLGERSYRIGLWVGGDSTPNKRKEAIFAYRKLLKDAASENPFILLKCPWCGAKFGTCSDTGKKGWARGKKKDGLPSILGYHLQKKGANSPETVIFKCGDPACEFGGSILKPDCLPIVVIDEDLLDAPPNLLIGTVDKFAMLSWKPDTRSIFGLGKNGRHTGAPPTLIIQDELHLISGPLGSMVGAYETVIETLCRQHGKGQTKPKIIASTATISRASEQVRNLYARDDVFLFPPSGLEAGDSFFARDSRNDGGSLKPGRMYVGIFAPSHGSLQTTQARVFACLMQNAAIMDTDDEGRDPWWTLICFFNSLRELGGAATLFVSDARDYLRVILDRKGIAYSRIRKLFNVNELTSRIRSDQIPNELERLEKPFAGDSPSGHEAVDACLASNIIEVGVDITRLALMAIIGQPKTTAQYIQVSSRIGRDPEKPGLVVTLYGPSKPRDRSHFERFRAYHQKLYSQVEPTSVTPFSPPAVERALHALLVALVRQLGDESASTRSDPFPLEAGTDLCRLIEAVVDDRVTRIAPEEKADVKRMLAQRLKEWKVWQPATYGGFGPPKEDPPLMHPAGSAELPEWNGHSWPTMSSLRNVDASCDANITGYYHFDSPGETE